MIQPKAISLRMANTLHTTTPAGFQVPESLIYLLPGFLLALSIAAFSNFMGVRFGGSVMLYALLAGLALHSLNSHAIFRPGISFSADTLLKIGVALLGVRITLVDVAGLGYQTAFLVIACVAVTLSVGFIIGRALGLRSDHAVLSAGAVAICGSSAALAIAAVLPKRENSECNTVTTVIGVTLLSTAAMVLYPLIATLLNLGDIAAGVFMGTTIHNVAQVVGAGFIISGETGDVATIVKLMRVACLLPVIMIISLMYRHKTSSEPSAKNPPLLPVFMIGFIAIMLVNSFGFIPSEAVHGLSKASSWGLVIAVAALGLQTSPKDIVRVGPAPFAALVLQTALLAIFALIVISSALTFT